MLLLALLAVVPAALCRCPIYGEVGRWTPTLLATSSDPNKVIVHVELWEPGRSADSPVNKGEAEILVDMTTGAEKSPLEKGDTEDHQIPFDSFLGLYRGDYDERAGRFVLRKESRGKEAVVAQVVLRGVSRAEDGRRVVKWWVSEKLALVYVFYSTDHGTDALAIAPLGKPGAARYVDGDLKMRMWDWSLVLGVLDDFGLVAVQEDPRNCSPVFKLYPFDGSRVGPATTALLLDRRLGGSLYTFRRAAGKDGGWSIVRVALRTAKETVMAIEPNPSRAALPGHADPRAKDIKDLLRRQDREDQGGGTARLVLLFAAPAVGTALVLALGVWGYLKYVKKTPPPVFSADGKTMTALVNKYDDGL
jgi:hypothetical protein